MGLEDYRAQLLANIQFLYGPNTSIITLTHLSGYQALVTRYDSAKNTWSKLLHSGYGITFTRENAMQSLLCESESEIAKRWASTGVEVPFRGDQRVVELCPQRLLTGTEEVADRASSASLDPPRFELLDSPQSSEDGKSEDIEGQNIGHLDMEPTEGNNSVRPTNLANGKEKKKKRNNTLQIDASCHKEDGETKDEPVCSSAGIADFNAEGISYPCKEVATVPSDPWKFWGVPKKYNKEMLALEDVQSPKPESKPVSLMTPSEITALNCAAIEGF